MDYTTLSKRVGYVYDSDAQEWYYTCSACREIMYAPTLKEIRKQFFRHALAQPKEARKCSKTY
jgi:hypothetical protein